jgi:CRISPR type I-E-associated protein CasA/Cse1
LALELLCCIFQSAMAPANALERLDFVRGKRLPRPEQLEALRTAYELDGAGPRFMQVPAASTAVHSSVSTLLFESPGESTIEQNKDFFIARNDAASMCSHCAPIALFLNQSHARMGGNGYKTGPRETSVLSALLEGATVWESICLNLLPAKWFDDQTGTPDDNVLHSFPWLHNQAALEKAQTLPLSTFGRYGVLFWTPVALHLAFTANEHQTPCLTCGSVTTDHVSGVARKSTTARLTDSVRHPHTGWNPMGNKGAGRAIETPKEGVTAEHWQALTITAAVDDSLPAWSYLNAKSASTVRLHAFGFAMNNMSAQFWLDETTPVMAQDTLEQRATLKIAAELLVAVAQKATAALRASLFRNPKKAVGNPSFTLTLTQSQGVHLLWSMFTPRIQNILTALPETGLTPEALDEFTSFVRAKAGSVFDKAAPDDGSNYEVSKSLLKRRANLLKKLQPKK